MFRLAIALCAALLPAAAQAAALAVVLAVDVSASVDADGYVLERDGIAAAFADPRLGAAIAALPGGIEAMVLEWSDPEAVSVAVDWRGIVDAAGAAAFAARVHTARRNSRGLTAIGPALLAAARQFDRLPEPAARRVIDLSGDGIANLGLPPALARDRIVASGITINALALPSAEPWVAGYYRAEVIGGAGAFVLEAQGEAGFARAMLRKLIAEVAGAPPRRRQAGTALSSQMQ